MSNIAYQQTALDRFYENLCYKPWCGDDKIANLVRPKASAIRRPYIAPNPPQMVYWLIFDIDITVSSACFWEDDALPAPNIVVKNKHNDKQHLYYAISPVCISDNARKKPIYYMKAVQRGLGQALGADPQYTGRIAKNPLCDDWCVYEIHAHEYTLDELSDYAAPISEVFDPFKKTDIPDSRNCALFERLRFWAYAHVASAREQGGYDTWQKAVLNQALELATIEADFGYNEIKNTAKSVAKWTWNHYFGEGKNRGVMELDDTDLSLEAKQRLAARRTHELRSTKTQKRVIDAIRQRLREGLKVNQKLVAADVDISPQQMSSRYRHLFEADFLELLEKEDRADGTQKIKARCHQVTTGLSEVGEFRTIEVLPLSASCVTSPDAVDLKDEGD